MKPETRGVNVVFEHGEAARGEIPQISENPMHHRDEYNQHHDTHHDKLQRARTPTCRTPNAASGGGTCKRCEGRFSELRASCGRARKGAALTFFGKSTRSIGDAHACGAGCARCRRRAAITRNETAT